MNFQDEPMSAFPNGFYSDGCECRLQGGKVVLGRQKLLGHRLKYMEANLVPSCAFRYQPVVGPCRQQLAGETIDDRLAVRTTRRAAGRPDLTGPSQQFMQVDPDRGRKVKARAHAVDQSHGADALGSP